MTCEDDILGRRKIEQTITISQITKKIIRKVTDMFVFA